MGSRAAASGANHCASTKAASQLANETTSTTKPRQAPTSRDITSTAMQIQSSDAKTVGTG
jgi:hypothetical protein